MNLRYILLTCALLFSSMSHAIITGEMMMIRSPHSFPETMATLQESVKQQGYVVSRVHRVDIGLTSSGYKTDKYRIVFIGKPAEIEQLSENHPQLIPYLPLKIAIFAEDQETLLVTTNPRALADLFPQTELEDIFDQWKADMAQILKRVQFSE